MREHPVDQTRPWTGRDVDQIWGLTPFGVPGAGLAVALARAGAFGVLDLGTSAPEARTALHRVARHVSTAFGVRVGAPAPVRPEELPAGVSTVVLAAGGPADRQRVARWHPRRVVAEVTTAEEAAAALDAGVDGLVAKGAESGGRVGDAGAFVLLQQLHRLQSRRGGEPAVPCWCRGGIGLHTAAAAVAGGAAGVVLEAQLALVREAELPARLRSVLGSMDGTETAVVAGCRLLARPDLPAPPEGASTEQVEDRLGVDLDWQLVAAGQDAALARPLARRFGTAGGVVHAVRTAISAQLAQARSLDVLEPGSAFAAAYGLRYPIAQGPMTRVSDRAAFAAAVAEEGALPFLALALMEPERAEGLLQETAAALAGRTWGVGILGFVPPDLRAGQLEAIRRVRPPVALVAGGRPAQARALEEAGIRTFLHVPSPGLLELFLREGARRFVFEGRECGGHVGPRSSFVLWEQQVQALLAGEVDGLDVLFAGGVHDARSAAMVAALAAPLAERGARVGVLMGTAYLFTAEAVATGAIQPAFQAEALDCQETVLLETGPGHTTRGARTAYARSFAEEAARLSRAEVPGPQRSAALEELNLGRLRIASKGLRRVGDRLVEVGPDEQRESGLFMIGQVATLRDSTTTLADLHGEVSEGGSRLLESLQGPEPGRSPAGAPLDVAIVGMACVFPGAPDTGTYWANLVAGRSAITEVPPERWDPVLYGSEAGTGTRGTATPSRWGGFLPEVPFDPISYGIPPASMGSIEPAQLLSLEVATRALADAGYAERSFDRSRTGVVFGAEGATELATAYGLRALAPTFLGALPAQLDRQLPALSEDSFPGVLTNVIAGRIANRLDLGGPNYTTDAACAASLASVHLACQELTTGTSDMMLCGGVDLHNGIYDYQLFAAVHALSPTGQCRPFDAGADGIVLGEGVACLVLKRLADAERDGDRVYAVIEGLGASSDGRHLGLTAPRGEGQRAALQRAYARAGRSPATVGLVEAHGTGTVVGDRTELTALTEVWTEAGARPGSCALGSVKSLIGHTKCAAGMAGLVKAARSVYHGTLPPTANLDRPNSCYDRRTSPFSFATEARPWPAASRRAGVSAFGFGGANFHVVLSSYEGEDRPVHGLDEWPAELVVARAPGAAQADAALADLERRLAGDPHSSLAQLARAAWDSSGDPVRVAVVARDRGDLVAKLAQARSGQPVPGVHRSAEWALAGSGPPGGPAGGRGPDGDGGPAVALLFPGQGSQRPGMLADLFVAFPRLQEVLALGPAWVERMYPPAPLDADDRDRQRARLTDTRAAQPALGLAGLAAGRLLTDLGLRPTALAGHSYGELVALCLAGAFSPESLLQLSQDRAEAMLGAAGDDPGTMVAVAAGAERVAPRLAPWPGVVVANDNSPGQVVISGPTAEVGQAAAALSAAGLAVRPLPVACAFHSPLLAGARRSLADALAEVKMGTLALPVWSNATAAPYPADPDRQRELLADQLARPVRFREEVEALYAGGVRVFVEAGPGQVLTQLVDRTLAGRPHAAVATDVPGVHGLEQLLTALAVVVTAGVPLQLEALWEGRLADTGPSDASGPRWSVNGHLVRTAQGTVVEGGLRPANEWPAQGGPAPAVAPEPMTGREREQVVIEYLQGVRQALGAAHEVVSRYLGGPAPHPAGEAAPPGDPAPAPAAPAPAAGADVLTGGGQPGPVPAPARPRSREELMATVVAVVAERTGYPEEMLGPDVELEADLGIDSIKRVEIVGALADRVQLPGAGSGPLDDSVIEELTIRKTLSAVVDWVLAQTGPELAPPPGPAPVEPALETLGRGPDPGEPAPGAPGNGAAAAGPAFPAAAEPGPVTGRVTTAGSVPSPRPPACPARYVQVLEEAGPPGAGPLAGSSFLVADDRRGVAAALVRLLQEGGAAARVVAAKGWEAGGAAPADALVHLGSLAPDPATPADVLAMVAPALGAGLRSLLVATGSGGWLGRPGTAGPAGPAPGSGMGGLTRTVGQEYPGVRVRLVDVDTGQDPEAVAAQLLAELRAGDELGEVGRPPGRRLRLRTVPQPLAQHGRRGVVPGPGDVVLVTGGARGITAEVAGALVRLGCHLELVGRTELPEPGEGPLTSACPDRASLRRALAGAGDHPDARAVEAAVSRILAQREVRATLANLGHAGGQTRYHAVDVRDAGAMAALVDGVYAHHGRLDGIVHGAGVIEDSLVAAKTSSSFARVWDTKVEGARTLLDAVRPPGTRFAVLFGSVAAPFGNPGQADYAAANDALEALAWARNGGPCGRVLCVHWGPWAGAGMVSPGLERRFARRGIGLIDPGDGTGSLLRELALGDPGTASVILARACPEALLARTG